MENNNTVIITIGILFFGVIIFYHIAYLYYKNKGMLKSTLKYGGVKFDEVTLVMIKDIYNRWKDRKKRK